MNNTTDRLQERLIEAAEVNAIASKNEATLRTAAAAQAYALATLALVQAWQAIELAKS